MQKRFTCLILTLILTYASSYAQYCLPTYTSQCTSGDYIDAVVFGSINNTGTGCSSPSANNYVDYTGLFSTICNPGQSYPITVTSGSSWSQSFGVWIDFNQDFDFADPGEFVFSSTVATTAPQSGTVTIPAGASPGTTRMRVLCSFSTPVPTSTQSCGSFSFGETEDYAIVISPASPNDLGVANITGIASGCGLGSNTPVTITVQNYGTNTQTNPQVFYNVSLNGGPFGAPVAGTLTSTTMTGGSSVIYTFPTGVNLSTPGNYVIQAWTALPNDGFVLNDTAQISVTSYPTITSYPYFENFDGLGLGWTAGAVGSGTSSWQKGNPSAKPIINTAYSAPNCWVTNLTGQYGGTDNCYLMGPCFDMSSLVLPVVECYIWWDTETGWDGARLQSSIDGGLTWQTVGSVGTGQNWYNTSSVIMLNNNFGAGGGWCGYNGNQSGGWLQAKADLTGLGGQSSVLLRFVFAADGIVSDGVAIDNFKVYDKPPIDFGITAVGLSSGCGYGGGLTPIPVTVQNFGTTIQSDPEVYYMMSYNGGSYTIPVVAIATGTFNPNATQNYTFTPGEDFSAPGNYTIKAFTMYPGDPDATNDTITYTFTSIPEINTYPYVEDFNVSNGAWVSGGTNSTWAWGNPVNKPLINTAYNGANCWVTNLNGNYLNSDVSWLRGPCFNFSTLVSPIVEFAIWWDTETGWDGARLQSSIDGGTTWQTVGTMGTGQNWYNAASASALTSNYGAGPGWIGSGTNGSGGWLLAKQDLTGLGGQPSVLLRFVFSSDGIIFADGVGIDGFKVYDKPNYDLRVSAILQPGNGGCGDPSATVQVQVKNEGILTQLNFPVKVFIPEIPTTLNATYVGSLAPNATGTLVMGTINTASGGIYTLKAYTDLAIDELRANDTTTQTYMYAALGTAPTPQDGLTCYTPDSVLLSVTGIDDTYYWYDAPVGGNLIGTGSSIYSPIISANTTYYVESRNLAIYHMPPYTNTSVGTTGFYTTTTQTLSFTVNNDVILDSVLVYYSNFTASTAIATVVDATGTQYFSASATLPAGAGKRYLIFPGGAHLAPGTYTMSNSGSSASLYRNSTGAIYPYSDPTNSVNITSCSAGAGIYTYFYDWAISQYGCPSTRVPVNAVVSVLPNVNLGNDAVVCDGYVLNGTTGTGNSYSWNTGATTPTITPAATGDYILNVTNTDGCVASDTINITVLAAPSVSLGADVQACTQSTVLDAGAQPSGNSYQWSSNAGAGQTQTVTVNANGMYWVAVTNPQGCTDYDSVNVAFVGIPLNLGPNISQCNGNAVTLNGGSFPNTTYSWSTGATTSSITVAAAGTYWVVATNGTCSNSDTISVGYGTPPTVNLGPDHAACGPVTLDAGNSGATFSWSTGAVTQAIVVTNSNNYSVTVTAANGCATTDAINIAIYQPTTGSISASGVSGSLYNFTSNVNAAIPYTYSWVFGDPNSANNTSSQQNPSHSFSANGTYTVTLYINNICGSAPFTTTVTVTGVGIEDEWNPAISIYPNPNTGIFTVGGSEVEVDDLTIDVFTVQGQKVATKSLGKVNGSFNEEFDLQNLAKGVYLVTIQDGVRKMYRKVVIE